LSESFSLKDADLEKEKLALTKENESLHIRQTEFIELSNKVERLNGQKLLIVERGRYDSEDAKIHDQALLLKEGALKVKNEIESTSHDITIKQNEVNDMNNKIGDLITNINSVKKSFATLESQRSNLVRTQLELKHKKSILEDTIENNSSLPYAVKNVLDNPKLRGIHDVIGRLISFDDQYSTAIDIALGASSLFVVTDNELTAKEAINYLKDNNLGRVTFFPISVIKERHIDMETYNMIKDHLSFVDIASNVLKYDDKYQNIILNQLGNVIIASDIDGANIIGKMINYRYKIVTLDGEVIHVGGSVTGGSIKKSNSIISERYELESINRKLLMLDTDIRDLDVQHNDMDAILKELELKHYNHNLEKSA
jgi:chromosome segregation protein